MDTQLKTWVVYFTVVAAGFTLVPRVPDTVLRTLHTSNHSLFVPDLLRKMVSLSSVDEDTGSERSKVTFPVAACDSGGPSPESSLLVTSLASPGGLALLSRGSEGQRLRAPATSLETAGFPCSLRGHASLAEGRPSSAAGP